jgi:hypothetical protein
MSELFSWVAYVRVGRALVGCFVQGLLLLLLGFGAIPILAEEDNPSTTEMGKMLDASTLIAREIEVQMVALQLDAEN